MRALTATLLFVAALTLTAGTRSVHRSETISDGESRLLNIVKTDDDYFATWEHNGKRYVTRDASVLAEIEAALAPHRELSKEHSAFGRRHSELGREHSKIGREHSRLAREHSRAAREGNVEARQRELEAMQRELERKQHELERRQRDLERQQRDLEAQQRTYEREADRKIDAIFERAARNGKAKRD